MRQFDPQAYGPVFSPVLAIDRRRELGAGRPEKASRPTLKALTLEAAFAHTRVVDEDSAACCLAGIWLLHDFLDESHTISQEVDISSGSFWHGIMHRREGDFSNAKYWFRHTGRHPAMGAIGQRAAELAAARGNEQAIKKLLNGSEWDPFAFVDLCQSAIRGTSQDADLCREIQQAEWELLFDSCYHEAIDK